VYSAGHVDHDYVDEEGLYSSPDLMVLIKRKIIKENKELDSLLDHLNQIHDVLERINILIVNVLNLHRIDLAKQ
jgi:hypothetical protein